MDKVLLSNIVKYEVFKINDATQQFLDVQPTTLVVLQHQARKVRAKTEHTQPSKLYLFVRYARASKSLKNPGFLLSEPWKLLRYLAFSEFSPRKSLEIALHTADSFLYENDFLISFRTAKVVLTVSFRACCFLSITEINQRFFAIG